MPVGSAYFRGCREMVIWAAPMWGARCSVGGGNVIGSWETSLILVDRVGVVMLVTRLLPGVPVAMVVTRPLSGVPVVSLRHLRRPPVRLLLLDHRGSGVSTVRPVVGAQGGRPLLLLPGLPGRPVLWGVGGCTG